MVLEELAKRFDETLIADLQTRTDRFGRARFGRLGQQCEDLLGHGIVQGQF